MEKQENYLLDLQRSIALQRDQHAYKKLFLHFYDTLIHFATDFLKKRESAEEIVSDALMKIWTMGEKLGEIQHIRTYLFISVKNRCLNQLKKEKEVFVEVDFAHFQSSSLDPEHLLLSKELAEMLNAAIDQLPTQCKMTFTLIREYGCSYKEAAEIMEISVNTVDRHLQIALRKLHEAIRHYYSLSDC